MNAEPLTHKDLGNNAISLAGEFAVLSQLALRGFDANMTLGNTKSVDILISEPRTGNMYKLEVKTHYRQTPSHSKMFGHSLGWMMFEKHETIINKNLYYCFVNIGYETHNFRFFIVPSVIVAQYVKEEHKLWLTGRRLDLYDTERRTFRIGIDTSGYPIQTPLAKDYENNWSFGLQHSTPNLEQVHQAVKPISV